jgi:cytidyltransferase-like protein
MIILLNGCFDCLHIGHKHLIRFAIKLAGPEGEVVILINNSESVKSLKGPKRPIQCTKDRVENVKGYYHLLNSVVWRSQRLPIVEVQTFSSEEELKEKVNRLSPSMIIKGNDRPDVREIVGSDKFPVCIVPRLKDNNGEPYSTTSMLEREHADTKRKETT